MTMNPLPLTAPATAVPSPLLPGFQIRPAAPADGRRLHAACYPHLSLRNYLAQFERAYSWQTAGRGLFLVAALADPAGELIGCGQLLRYPRCAEIADLHVAAAYRNRGVGGALLDQLWTTAVAWGVPAVEIGVTADNQAARRLYQRRGFVMDRELKIPGGAGTAVILRRENALDLTG
jgi:ribosomal protein S18 acetylase RimI-like enzyme